MANPIRNSNGTYRLTVSFSRSRVVLTLGKVSEQFANRFAANLNAVIDQKKSCDNFCFPGLIEWARNLSRRHKEQLSSLGVLDLLKNDLTVAELVADFRSDYDIRKDIAASTKTQFRVNMLRFPPYFMAKRIHEIEPEQPPFRPNAKPVFSQAAKVLFLEVNAWQDERYARASWSKANKRLKEVGNWAVDHGLCDYNPFAPLPTPGELNEENNIYVEPEWVDDAMEAVTQPDTRLLFALGRYRGLRIPSEARSMKAEHVDFDRGTLLIIDSKRKTFRVMPMFRRLRAELTRHQLEQPWWEYVLSEGTRGDSDGNNYTLMKEAVERTTHKRWPRLRQNLRASCENHLLRMGFAERQVTAWLGHTVSVSRRHYQKQVQQDFEAAISKAEY